MAESICSSISCGVRELCDLSGDPKKDIRDLFDTELSEYYGYGKIIFSQVMFSDRVKQKNAKGRWIKGFSGGINLARFIRDNKLGRIVESSEVVNRNHPDHKIKTWIWHLSNIRKTMKIVGYKPEKLDDENNYRWR
ncbi:MAG: hypothetical protein KGL39_08805 [Patescibacteria group bacterium]|nr:hypothetical protein [Patescibacteria group bacterium]